MTSLLRVEDQVSILWVILWITQVSIARRSQYFLPFPPVKISGGERLRLRRKEFRKVEQRPNLKNMGTE